MRIAVCVKQVPDPRLPARLDPVTLRLDRSGPAVLDPASAAALSMGMSLAAGGPVHAISMGPPGAEDAVRRALALGAETGSLVTDQALEGADALTTARVLAAAVCRGGPALVLCGLEAADSGLGVVPGALAELLGLPLVSAVVEAAAHGGVVRARRRLIEGEELVAVTAPALLSVHALPGISTPTLAAVRAARRRPLEVLDLNALGLAGSLNGAQKVVGVRQVTRPRRGEVHRDAGDGGRRIADLLASAGIISGEPTPRDAGEPALPGSGEPVPRRSGEPAPPGPGRPVPPGPGEPAPLDPRPGTHVLPSTRSGRDAAGVTAARTGATVICGATGARVTDGGLEVTCEALGGSLELSVRVAGEEAVLVAAPGHRLGSPEPWPAAGGVAAGDSLGPDPSPDGATRAPRLLRRDPAPPLTGAPLSRARVVLAGGAGASGPETFALLEEVALMLGGAVGASRGAIDAGWAPHGALIGQSGSAVAPEVYIAAGISGASQHLAGIRQARAVIAVNRDELAPLVAMADLAVIGDADAVIRQLRDELRERRPPR